ncbi:MAG: hypothetical protein SCALA702_10940 [Melioribacteraceae bacterium]|nr:MAG: hypothetical protein SCALA702_10940 [Melioribacteraceae bacterium]
MINRYFSHEDIKQKFVAVRQRAISIYKELTDNCFKYEFDQEKWNICQHFDHLLKFGEYHIPVLDRVLLNVVENRLFSNEPLHLHPGEEKLIDRIQNTHEDLLSPSYLFMPENNRSKGSVFIKFVSMQDLFISQINLVDGYSLSEFEVELTLDYGYTLKPGTAFLMIAGYEMRHLEFVEHLKTEMAAENLDLV